MAVEMDERYSSHRSDDPEKRAAVDAALHIPTEKVLATVLVVDSEAHAVAHAVLRDLAGEWEVKRVIVDASVRGRGVGRLLMNSLADIARARGARRLILQTGNRQPDAVALYERLGYQSIPVYEPYIEAIPFSLCYELPLR
ncbi:GNAT family N-acetyltransferase [Nakamurella antarctica]|uniref:GNAT family N-acetyltransferase n=2 Tax=Nakamurella antarctica TaxID=1902245 RepID=A0A3G8ZQS8_9ACTN|nr:GNAT family N-acetyltransferase [Nakamurella antarctica]